MEEVYIKITLSYKRVNLDRINQSLSIVFWILVGLYIIYIYIYTWAVLLIIR